MKQEIESIVLENKGGQRLRIYRVEGSCDEYCIGLDGESDHFVFTAEESVIIRESIERVIDED